MRNSLKLRQLLAEGWWGLQCSATGSKFPLILLAQVYKIVPGLEQNEYDRERDFYRDKGLPCPKDQVVEPEEEDSKDGEMTPDANTNMDFHRFDEQVRQIISCQV